MIVTEILLGMRRATRRQPSGNSGSSPLKTQSRHPLPAINNNQGDSWVVTTQVFDFGGADGEDTVVTHGIELSDIDVDVDRAVIGGTGEHAGAAGVQTQTLRGFNASEGVNLTVVFQPAD